MAAGPDETLFQVYPRLVTSASSRSAHRIVVSALLHTSTHPRLRETSAGYHKIVNTMHPLIIVSILLIVGNVDFLGFCYFSCSSHLTAKDRAFFWQTIGKKSYCQLHCWYGRILALQLATAIDTSYFLNFRLLKTLLTPICPLVP